MAIRDGEAVDGSGMPLARRRIHCQIA